MARLSLSFLAAAVAGAGATEAALRVAYMALDAEIGATGRARLDRGDPPEQVARDAVQARNDAKATMRAWDFDAMRLTAEARNREKYGNALGPSYEWLVASGKTDARALVESASRTNATVDAGALGLGAVSALILAASVGTAWRSARTWRVGVGLLSAMVLAIGLAKLLGALVASGGIAVAALGAAAGIGLGAAIGRRIAGAPGS